MTTSEFPETRILINPGRMYRHLFQRLQFVNHSVSIARRSLQTTIMAQERSKAFVQLDEFKNQQKEVI